MAKNEKESAQILISALKDVSSYSLETATLTSANGDTIAKENVAVFSQHYMNTSSRSNAIYDTGWYPDALIPLDKRIEASETTIAAGDNQAIWFTITTDKETESGVYTGNFTLEVNGATKQIPVTVIYDENGDELDDAKRVQAHYKIPCPYPVPKGAYLRRKQ